MNAPGRMQFRSGDRLSDAILLAIAEKEVPKLLNTLESVFGTGRDPRSVVESLIYRLSELTGISWRRRVTSTRSR